MEKKPLKLLTFNTWGLKYVSKHRKERLNAIAHQLAQSDYDVVALQEVWVQEDWDYIESRCKHIFPYRRQFRSGILTGPGLSILLKVPISSTFLYRFPINGRPSAFFRGDWFVGKSIAVTILDPKVPGSSQIAVLNSHMHAPYAQTGDAAYATHRACQAWDLAKLVSTLRKAGYAVVQVGDLNSKPGLLPYRLFTIEGGLADSWDVLHGELALLSDEIAVMDAREQIERGGVTCNSRINTWRANRAPWEACRLDYALIDQDRLTPILAGVHFTELLPLPISCSFSDHFAYCVELAMTTVVSDTTHHSVAEKSEVYQELIANVENYLNETIPFQENWRKWHLILSLIIVVLIQIAITFAAIALPWATIFLSIGSTLIGITGIVNGMIWYFGVRSEKRALEEVKMEVEDALRALELSN
ncbi:CIC11C00000005009 [Sungouiella intermedia]|uniref:CIC11C00000005009 n=1 Tax=Sungouiella intermedia TaxID=45354 RepID=A0A1L0DA89_9ASCO|nr:CIC11C00000005009 [[Candida] intermedia]